MGIKQKTVFISYRRTNFYTALAVYQDLTANGYDCFFDYESIDSGDFETVIFENIRYRAHFVVILSPSALERLGEKNSVMRREVELAIDEKRNIIPLMMESFDFGNSAAQEALTGKLASLSSYNGLKLVPEYIFASMEKLRRFLNVELDAVRQPALSATVEEDTEKLQVKASEEPVVQEESLSAEEWFEQGYFFNEFNDYLEAIRCYSKAIELNPKDFAAHNNLGLILDTKLERYVEAEESYRKAIEIAPTEEIIHNNLGLLLQKKTSRYEEAEAVFRKASELNPVSATSYFNLGNLLYKDLNRYEEAEEAYKTAIKLNPKDDHVYSNLGSLLSDSNRFTEAEATYKKAIELNPEEPTSYFNLGCLLDKMLNRHADAETAYRKAIKLDPEFAEAHNNLGYILQDLGRYSEAKEAYKRALEINPEFSLANKNLVLLQLDYDEDI